MQSHVTTCSVAILMALGTAAAQTLEQWTLPERPPGPHFPAKAADIPMDQSFDADQPVVGTYYFYWYDIDSKSHVFYADGGDTLTDHPPTLEGFSYKNPDWHKQEMEDMMDEMRGTIEEFKKRRR